MLQDMISKVPTSDALVSAGVDEADIIAMDLSSWVKDVYLMQDKLYKTHSSARSSKEGVTGNWAVNDIWRYVLQDSKKVDLRV